jgi:chromosomal replication initiator protein
MKMDKDKIWHAVLDIIRVNLSAANFSTWFPQTFVVNQKTVDETRVITEIACPSSFIRDTVEMRYYGLIKDALNQATGKVNDLVFCVKQREKTNGTARVNETPLFEEKTETKETEQSTELERALKRASLRADYNFDNFAVSSSNQMAYAAAEAVAQSPGKAYNPLFLYGGTGVGKTHLMQAVGIKVLQENPKTKLIYCMGEEFTNEIINAIRSKTTKEFKDRYRSVKILLIDDIQFLAGKTAVQEEFFHTFNTITREGGQVVMTSDRKPEEIERLEDRLRSRFEGGLIIDIQKPDFELRTAILLIKAQQKKINLPMDVARLIAGNITSIRKIEGFLMRVITEAQFKQVPITPDLVSALLGQVSEITNKKVVRPKEVLSIVAGHYELRLADLTGQRRLKNMAEARQVLMYLLRTELKIPLMEIGRLLGGRDHTTIMHGVEKITNNLSTCEQLRVDIAGIKQRLYG